MDATDMSAVLSGGDDFRKRMKELQDATSALEQARADLGLAKKAKEVHAEAASIMAAAKQMLKDAETKANQTITDANLKAAETVNSANSKAGSIVNAAENTASAKLSSAENVAAQLHADAVQSQKAANEAKSNSEILHANAGVAHNAATKALAEAMARHGELDKREAALFDKANNLKAAIAACMG